MVLIERNLRYAKFLSWNDIIYNKSSLKASEWISTDFACYFSPFCVFFLDSIKQIHSNNKAHIIIYFTQHSKMNT